MTAQVVSREMLAALAAEAPQPPKELPAGPGGKFNLEDWIVRHGLPVTRSAPWNGGKKWILNPCPWNAEHTNEAAFVVQHASGAVSAGCHHDGCAGKNWHALRDVFDPGWRERKAAAERPAVNGRAAQPEERPAADAKPEVAVPDPTPWPEAPAPQAYAGLAGEIVRTIEPQTEADPVAVLIQILVMFGNVIGRRAHFVVEEDRHYGNLFVCLVGQTAKGRKGTSRGRALKVFDKVEDSWAKTRLASGLSSGEGLIWAVRDPIFKKEAVKEKGRVKEYEPVMTDEGVDDKRLLVTESEFAMALRSSGREGNTLSARIREAWDTGTLNTLTKNSPARATDAHISIIGHVTKEELLKTMNEVEVTNGFANRFLWLVVKRSKLLPLGGLPVDLGRLSHKMALAVEMAQKRTEVAFDDGAKAFWSGTVYPALSAGEPGIVGSVTNRAEAQVRRLALLYALLDFSDDVKVCHVESALAVWDYAERSARWIWGESCGDKVADKILHHLQEAGKPVGQNELKRAVFSDHLDHDRFAAAMQVLMTNKLVRKEKASTGGRPTTLWSAACVKRVVSGTSEEIKDAAKS